MGRNGTGAISVNECLSINVNSYIKTISLSSFPISGNMSWSTGASISFILNKNEGSIFLELVYSKTFNKGKKNFNYKIGVVSVPSNLGRGYNYYFICPISGQRCKILYMAYGSNYFKSRSGYQNRIYYASQLSSRLNYNNDIYWRIERKLQTLNIKHPKTHYKGECTRPQKRIKKLIEKKNYHDGLRLNILSDKLIKIMNLK